MGQMIWIYHEKYNEIHYLDASIIAIIDVVIVGIIITGDSYNMVVEGLVWGICLIALLSVLFATLKEQEVDLFRGHKGNEILSIGSDKTEHLTL
ncbi:MAG: hypothetical protein QM221_02505 [Bacillota bacterium]|nr:hypothetical protein [Bacillota bacterium]